MSAHRTTATLARCALTVASLLSLAVWATGDLHAQVALFPVQNLTFGDLRPGQTELVGIDDPVRRAELELVGTGRVIITVGLPAEMLSVDGHRLRLDFSNKDAALEMRNSGKVRTFNPNKSKRIKIGKNEDGARIHIGGMALPDAAQPAGRYSATITIQIVAAGT